MRVRIAEAVGTLTPFRRVSSSRRCRSSRARSTSRDVRRTAAAALRPEWWIASQPAAAAPAGRGPPPPPGPPPRGENPGRRGPEVVEAVEDPGVGGGRAAPKIRAKGRPGGGRGGGLPPRAPPPRRERSGSTRQPE